jgi:hypothetical protein
MTRPPADVVQVAALLDQGFSQAEAARRSGVPQRTVNKWARAGVDTVARKRQASTVPCLPCPHVSRVPEDPYAYLLGLYLGDGCLATYPREVFRLHITVCALYPNTIQECRAAMGRVLPNKVNQVNRRGCVDVVSYSKHWPCLFPQHGPGQQHTRSIRLEPWQEAIALDHSPHLFLRGLVHSDGWRGVNRVGKGYEYSRYQFSNRSDDIRHIFQQACERVGVRCRPSGPWHMSVSRRSDVEYMDTFIGPKS